MTNGETTAVAAPRLAPVVTPDRSRLQIGLYFGLLTTASGQTHPAKLLRLPLQFWLKKSRNVSPQTSRCFGAVVFAPVFAGG
jgi:hypothetical protein